MKKLIATAALLVVSSVHAQQLEFGDLNYFLTQSQYNLSADINLSTYQEKQEAAASTKYETEGYFINTRLAYGVNEKLTAFLGLDYQYDVEVADKTNTSVGTSNQDGLANPAFGAFYRFLNQSDAGVNFDLGAALRFGIEDAVTGTGGKDGNAADGRNSLELNARVGNKWNEANEWQFVGGFVYHQVGEYEFKGPAATADIEEDASMDYFARASYQYRPVKEFMMTVGLQGTMVGAVDSEDKDSKEKYDTDSHLDWDFTFNAKYLVTEAFIVKFNYLQGNNPDFDGKIADQDAEFKGRREHYFGLGADWLF